MNETKKLMDLLCQAMLPTCNFDCIEKDVLYCSTCSTIADYFCKRGINISFCDIHNKEDNKNNYEIEVKKIESENTK